MASAQRTSSDTLTGSGSTRPPTISATLAPENAEKLERDLLSNAKYYDFFYVVGMLERLTPEAIRVGGDGPYDRETIRFRHEPSLTFKPGDIDAARKVEVPRAPEDLFDGKRERFELTTSFLGLTGSVSPLPLYMAEEIAQAQDSAPVKRDFLDIFHHRLISFVYRIGVKYDLAREYSSNAGDDWSRRLLALAGFDVWSGRTLRYIPMWRLLRLAPLFANRVRSARTLEIAIEDVCGEALQEAHVRIEQFSGDWSPLDEDQRMALGIINNMLGQDSVLGMKCYDKAGKAIIEIGPLGDNFRRFLSDGDMYPVVIELLGLLTHEPVEFELELVLGGQSRPPFHLGVRIGARLGTDSWLASEKAARDETRMRVPLPSELPQGPDAFKPKWQSQPQRR